LRGKKMIQRSLLEGKAKKMVKSTDYAECVSNKKSTLKEEAEDHRGGDRTP